MGDSNTEATEVNYVCAGLMDSSQCVFEVLNESDYISRAELKLQFEFSEDAQYAKWTTNGILSEIDDCPSAPVIPISFIQERAQYLKETSDVESYQELCNLLQAWRKKT